MPKVPKHQRAAPGPKPLSVVIEGDWTLAVTRAMAKGKPPAEVGKPKPRKKKRPPN